MKAFWVRGIPKSLEQDSWWLVEKKLKPSQHAIKTEFAKPKAAHAKMALNIQAPKVLLEN